MILILICVHIKMALGVIMKSVIFLLYLLLSGKVTELGNVKPYDYDKRHDDGVT